MKRAVAILLLSLVMRRQYPTLANTGLVLSIVSLVASVLWSAAQSAGTALDLGLGTGGMERLADYIEERNGLRGKILTAFIYPGVVGLVSIGIVIFLLSYVVPQVVSAFSQARQDLPGLTLAMLAASDFIRAWGGLCFAGMLGGFWGWR